MNRILFAAALFAACFGAGLSLTRASQPAAPSPLPTPASRAGAHSALDLGMHPAAVRATRRGEVLDFRLDLGHQFAGRARARYAVEIVDDLGNAVRAPELSERVELDATGFSVPVTLPDDMADGFYLVRVTVAARDDDDATVEMLHEAIEIVGGSAIPLDINDWLTRSRASEGVSR